MTKLRLNGNQLKLLALITMTIDHIGMYLLPQYFIFRIIGRLSMPIYAYMIAEGCRYTRNRGKYLLLTAGVGLLCQVVYYVAMGSLYQCILITFSLSILLIYSIDNAIKRQSIPACLLVLGALAAVFFLSRVLPALLPGTDYYISYGYFGILLPVFTFLGRNRRQQLLLTALGQVIMNLDLGGIQWLCLLTLIPLALYDGTRGKMKLKYLFYIYYPAHLAALYGIGLLVK